jgi:hypothetical protein
VTEGGRKEGRVKREREREKRNVGEPVHRIALLTKKVLRTVKKTRPPTETRTMYHWNSKQVC